MKISNNKCAQQFFGLVFFIKSPKNSTILELKLFSIDKSNRKFSHLVHRESDLRRQVQEKTRGRNY